MPMMNFRAKLFSNMQKSFKQKPASRGDPILQVLKQIKETNVHAAVSNMKKFSLLKTTHIKVIDDHSRTNLYHTSAMASIKTAAKCRSTTNHSLITAKTATAYTKAHSDFIAKVSCSSLKERTMIQVASKDCSCSLYVDFFRAK
jgi:hypothetical protein